MNDVARASGLSSTTIRDIENGKLSPTLPALQEIADALHVDTLDFMSPDVPSLEILHSTFRPGTKLSRMEKAYIHEAAEDYARRFFFTVGLFRTKVLKDTRPCHSLSMKSGVDASALRMRKILGKPETDPVSDLVASLEVSGIPVMELPEFPGRFLSYGCSVNGRPLLVISSALPEYEKRETLATELTRLMFKTDPKSSIRESEQAAADIGSSFLISDEDIQMEFGFLSCVTRKQVDELCRKYGITMNTVLERCIRMSAISRRTARSLKQESDDTDSNPVDPPRTLPEQPTLFPRLLLRAVQEEGLTLQMASQLLEVPRDQIAEAIGYDR